MRRRWMQFSLRGLLVTTMALALWLGWVAERAMRQKEAVALLEGWGARIDYAHQWQGPLKPRKTGPPPGWSWLRKLLGPQFFDKVVSVELVAGGRIWTAAEEAALRRGDAIAPPRMLKLSDEDLTALGYLPDLRRLTVVGDFNVTASGVRRLGSLNKLDTLILDNTSGRSRGSITDESLAFIRRMPRLTTLHLEGNPVSDDGLKSVRWPAGLAELDLSGAKISDEGLRHLESIATLRRLAIVDCRVSDAGVADFQRALPRCEVTRRLW